MLRLPLRIKKTEPLLRRRGQLQAAPRGEPGVHFVDSHTSVVTEGRERAEKATASLDWQVAGLTLKGTDSQALSWAS